MKNAVTGKQIRAEVAFLEEELRRSRLSEKWLKDSDPSITILDFLEEVSQSIGAIKRSYAASAGDRNAIADVVLKEVGDIVGACDRLREGMTAAASDPEDTNSSIAP